MILVEVFNHEDLYKDDVIKTLFSYAIFGATDGKIKSAAQSLYSKQQGLIYVCKIDEEAVGIIGLKQYDNTKLELLHLAVKPSARGQGFGAWMIKEVLERTGLPYVFMEADGQESMYLESIGFKVKETNDTGLDQYICTYRLKK